MDKGSHNKATACQVKRNNRNLPKAFQVGLLKLSIRNTNTEKHLKLRSRHKHGAGLEYYPFYSIG